MIKSNEDKINQINKKNQDSEEGKVGQHAATSLLENLGRSLNKQKEKYQEILDNLRTYAAQSSSLVEDLGTDISQAIQAISVGYKGGTGKEAWDSKSQEDLLGKIASNVSTSLSWEK